MSNKEYYDAYAESFAGSRKQMHWPEIDLLKKYLLPTTKILDVGCGSGRLLEHLNIAPTNYLGIDNSSGMIAQAQKQHSDHTFAVMDMLNIHTDFKPDVIVCIASFHHLLTIQDQQSAIQTFYDLLEPNGLVFMTNWHLPNAHVELNEKIGTIQTTTGHKREYFDFTKQEIISLCESVGFEVIHAQYVNEGKEVSMADAKNMVHIAKK